MNETIENKNFMQFFPFFNYATDYTPRLAMNRTIDFTMK